MPGFRYQAYNLDGKLHKGVLEADSARQARALLRDQGLTPHRVDVIAANDPAGGSRVRPMSLSATEVAQLTRGLASLLEAGLTVEQAFNALIEQAHQQLLILTRALIALSGILRATWVLWVVLLVAGVGALRYALRRERPRAAIHRALYRAPALGRVLRHLDASRLSATLSIL